MFYREIQMQMYKKKFGAEKTKKLSMGTTVFQTSNINQFLLILS